MNKLLFLLSIIFPSLVFSQSKVLSADASKHIGDSVIIIDSVYAVKSLPDGRMLVHLGGESPNQSLTVVITNEFRRLRKIEEDNLINARIAVTGKLIDENGIPQIMVTNPQQIKHVQIYFKK
jgi:hypothetical protein